MTTTYTLSTIQQAVELGTTMPRCWYRGHARKYGDLTPRIFRSEYGSEYRNLIHPDPEIGMITLFKRWAPALSAGLPAQDDDAAWLFLMQHHGLPTRLLDWTESVLVGLYFAVDKDGDQDGELWCMDPAKLNEKHYQRPVMPLLHNSPTFEYLVEEAWWRGNREELARRVGRQSPARYPLAIEPPVSLPRMIAQMSVFTIHPGPEPDTETISEVITDKKCLVRYIVPADKKKELKRHLADLGVLRRSLFPDLDALSFSVTEYFRMSPGPRKPPPNFGEEES